jgi:hypothetical protein
MIAMIATVSLSACDDVSYQAGAQGAQPPVFQPQTMRSLVNEAGLQALYPVENPLGALLDYPAEHTTDWGIDLTLGPITRHVTVESWEVSAQADHLEVSIEARDIAVVVPVRIQERVGARICRYSVEADHVSIQSAAALVDADPLPLIEVVGQPSVTWSHPTVNLVGDCPQLEDVASEDPDSFALDQLFVDYLTRAFEASGREAIELSPLDTLGLIHSPVGLSRVSNFENRRGQLLVSARVSSNASLSQQGFAADVDMSLNSRRAGCAPALIPDAPAAQSADEVPAAQLDRAGADVGLTLATPLLLRLAQTSTLAGFGCRGLEDMSLDGGSSSNLAVDDLNLEDVGLSELPIGPWAEPVLAPGSLPAIVMDAQSSTIELSWDDLTLDFYAEIQGVPVRILQLDADVTVSLRPVERLASIELAVESVAVADASIESQWIYEFPAQADLQRWTRRAMLLVLQDAFSLPLPMEPGAPLQLVDSQVRPNDLLLLFKLDRSF